MEREYLEKQENVVELLEDNDFAVLSTTIEQYVAEDPRSATLEVAIAIDDEADGEEDNPYLVK